MPGIQLLPTQRRPDDRPVRGPVAAARPARAAEADPARVPGPPAAVRAGRLHSATFARAGVAAHRAARMVRSAPLAFSVAAAVLTAGAVTGTLVGTAAYDRPLVHDLAYGLPALVDGRWFSLLGGTLLVPRPALYPVVAALLAVAVGFLERKVGAARTAAVLIGTQVLGALGAAALLAAASSVRWPWAHTVATHLDTGMSAGVVGALAAATALMSPVCRARVRWAVGGYLAIMVLRSGLLWDLEHAVGFAAGLAAGPLLAGRRQVAGHATAERAAVAATGRAAGSTTGRAAGPVAQAAAAGRADVRLPRLVRIRGAVALLIVLVPVTSVVLAAYPGYGGIFGTGTLQPPLRLLPALIQVAIALVIAKALRRGLPAAWWAGVVFCAVPLGASLAGALLTAPTGSVAGPLSALAPLSGRIGDLLTWAAVLGALIICRRCWPRRLPAVVLRRHLPRLVAATTLFAGVWWLMLTVAGPHTGVRPHQRGHAVLVTATFGTATRPDVAWLRFVLGLSVWMWAATLVTLLLPMLLSAAGTGRARGDRGGRDRVTELLRRHGGGSLGWQRTWPGFAAWTTRAGDVAVSYRIVSGVALVLGDPVGPIDRWAAAVAEFRRFCLHAGWTVCWYSVTPAFADTCGEQWHLTQVGEDAVLDLPGLEFRGKAWQDVRTARNHAAREGITMRQVDVANAPAELLEQIAEVSRGWSRSKPLPEMGFTLGTVEHARDGQMRTHIAVDGAGTVHGVTTWLPVHDGGAVVGWTLDVMRRRIGGFRPVIEFLIAESALAFQAEGCRTLSLSVAPLARCAAGDGQPGGPRQGRLDALLDRTSRMLEPAYGFRSLLEFKRKFHPVFTPVYLGYADEIDLSQITVAIGKAYLPHLTVRQAGRVVRTLWGARRGRSRSGDASTAGPSGDAVAGSAAGAAMPAGVR